jgi:hypothetical protein
LFIGLFVCLSLVRHIPVSHTFIEGSFHNLVVSVSVFGASIVIVIEERPRGQMTHCVRVLKKNILHLCFGFKARAFREKSKANNLISSTQGTHKGSSCKVIAFRLAVPCCCHEL